MVLSKPQRAKVAERRAEAIGLRLAGMDWDTIATRLHYADKAAACKDVSRALAARLEEEGRAVEEYREVELMRLDRLQAAAWPAALAGDVRSIEAVLRLMIGRWKLLGLEAPVRAEVLTIDAINAEIQSLSGQVGGGDPVGEVAGPPAIEA